MARPTKKTGSRGKQLTLSQRLLRWCFQPRKLMVGALLAMGLVLWPRVQQSLPDVAGQPEYQVTAEQIMVTPPPRWIPEDLVQDVLGRVKLTDPLSLHDPALRERIAAAFITHPWIEKVHRVEKSFPAKVRVDVTYRRPVAMVLGVDGYYPLDSRGCVLPGNDFSHSDTERYPVIENVSSVPQAGQGQPWGDPAVEGAALLAALLYQPADPGKTYWEQWGLTAIQAPSVVGLPDEQHDLKYQLRTRGGSTIIWGRSPATQHPGEPSVEQKIARLSEYYQDFGSFDDGRAAWVFDLREWRGIMRHLAEGPSDRRQ